MLKRIFPLLLITVFGLIFLLVSCDPISSITYSIHNNSTHKIIVTSKIASNSETKEVTIGPNQQITIFIDQTTGKVDRYQTINNKIPINIFNIVSPTVVLQYDPAQLEKWIYTSSSEQEANYRLILTDNDFE